MRYISAIIIGLIAIRSVIHIIEMMSKRATKQREATSHSAPPSYMETYQCAVCSGVNTSKVGDVKVSEYNVVTGEVRKSPAYKCNDCGVYDAVHNMERVLWPMDVFMGGNSTTDDKQRCDGGMCG